MTTQVARLCARCHKSVLRALTSQVQDYYGQRPYTVCIDCLQPGARSPRR